MHAVPRIAYRGLIDNVQVSWVKIGPSGAEQILRAGANDLGGTLMDENISRAAGAQHGQGLTEQDFRDIAEPLGRRTRQRLTGYQNARRCAAGAQPRAPAHEQRNRPQAHSVGVARQSRLSDCATTRRSRLSDCATTQQSRLSAVITNACAVARGSGASRRRRPMRRGVRFEVR